MVILKWLGYLLLALVVVVGTLVVFARFHDGPLAMLPGGELRSGEMVTHRN